MNIYIWKVLLKLLLGILLCLLINTPASTPTYSQDFTKCTANAAVTAIVADADIHTAATSGTRLLCGFSVSETAGAVAKVIPKVGVVSGGNCTGNPIHAQINLVANESVLYSLDSPVNISAGFCIDRLSGTTAVSTLTRP